MQYPIVLPTDTIYGIVAPALDQPAVLNLYRVKGRPENKPFIILINNIDDLKKFKIKLTTEQQNKLDELWPGPVSVILPCPEEEFTYLHRGTKTLAFRLPALPQLRKLLDQTGPLVAPSANPTGQPPAQNIDEAKKYFGNQVPLYISGKVENNQPSTVITLSEDGQIKIIRQGVANIKPNKVQ